MGVGLVTATVGAIGSKRAQKKLGKLLKNAPKYSINKEAFENQNVARTRAFGKDRDVQMQQENIEQSAAQAANQAQDVSSSTAALLNTMSAIQANRTGAQRDLTQMEAGLRNQRMAEFFGAQNMMIDEKDKAWNYNTNMPFQMKVAAQRDRQKYNTELMLKGVEAQAATDAAGIQAMGQMFGAMGASDERVKKDINDSFYGLKEVIEMNPVTFKYINDDYNTHIGLIAQQLQKLVPHAVSESIEPVAMGSEERVLTIDYRMLVPVLIKAIQEQQEQITALKEEFKSMKVNA